jgi:ATP-dependent Clp protease adaptor protein ClpS
VKAATSCRHPGGPAAAGAAARQRAETRNPYRRLMANQLLSTRTSTQSGAKHGAPTPMPSDGDKDLTRRSDDGRGLAVEEARPKLKRPPLYRVLLLNDDYTPMEFVVEVLQLIFGMDRPTATRVMLEVHTKGKGVCGVYVYEIAETKVAQVTSYAQQHQHPLLCTLEEA